MANLQEFRVERHPSTIPQLIQSIGVEFLAFSSSHDHLQVQKNSKSMEDLKLLELHRWQISRSFVSKGTLALFPN